MFPRIDKEACIDCCECVNVCPGLVFSHTEEGVKVTHPQECIECRACEDACPTGALTLIEE